MSRQKIAPDVVDFLRSGIDVPSEAFARQIRALIGAAEALRFALDEAEARMAEHTRRGMVVWQETEGLIRSRKAWARLARVSRSSRGSR